MSTRLLRANSSARDGVSNSSRLSLPSICRTISASSSRLENRSSTIRTVLRWARAKASSETVPGGGADRNGEGGAMANHRSGGRRNRDQAGNVPTGAIPGGRRTGASARRRKSSGRGEKIRTSDPLHPMQVRYQAALRPDRNYRLYRSEGSRRQPKEGLAALGVQKPADLGQLMTQRGSRRQRGRG